MPRPGEQRIIGHNALPRHARRGLARLPPTYINHGRRIGRADEATELPGNRNKMARRRHGSPPYAKETAFGPCEPEERGDRREPRIRRTKAISISIQVRIPHSSPLTIRRSPADAALGRTYLKEFPTETPCPTRSILPAALRWSPAAHRESGGRSPSGSWTPAPPSRSGIATCRLRSRRPRH